MEVFKNLFNDWVGLLSLGTILFILGMMVFFVILFVRKANSD